MWSGPSGMAAITAGVCVFLSLLALFPFLLLWLPVVSCPDYFSPFFRRARKMRSGNETRLPGGERVSTSLLRWTVCLGLPPLVAWYGVRRKSLDLSGGVAAILVGFVLTVGSACFCVSLLVFFFTSSRLTRWRGREKEKYEDEHKEGVCLCACVHECMTVCVHVCWPQWFGNPLKPSVGGCLVRHSCAVTYPDVRWLSSSMAKFVTLSYQSRVKTCEMTFM